MDTRSLLGLAALAFVLGLGLAGCDVTAPGGADTGLTYQSSQPIRGVDRDKVYVAALAEMRARFRVADSDAVAGTINCQPDYLDSSSATSTTQFRIISTKSDQRRVVHVRVPAEGGVVRIEVLASLERRDTQQMRQYQAIRAGGDAPLETPIDTGANRDPERREVWTPVGRDHSLESDLLQAIQSRLAGTTQPAK
ncbi:MAG: hypothetical protein PHU85_12800 [Phycisphaerae bacterium]|nr:hypothetical protein [Phycisphaerae bacterium]